MTIVIGTILLGLAGLAATAGAGRGLREDHAPIPVRSDDRRHR